MNGKTVVVGLSGGVDSSVAAYLLKEQGYNVIGLFMRNWSDTTGTLEGDCPWHDDRVFAELVAKRLDIPFRFIDLSDEYRRRVVDYMFAEYGRGRTPNPDVLCNREIKFDAFLKAAMDMGADYVATGHYCRKRTLADEHGNPVYSLVAGADPNKDQSYFLCQLSQEQLKYALFPIGELLKPEVRAIAARERLATAERKDSQGICFVGKVDLPVFLQQKLAPKQGGIVEVDSAWKEYSRYQLRVNEWNESEKISLIPALATPFSYDDADGKKVGEHPGAHYYTVGQRKGLNVGGKPEPLFVIGTDTEKNVIYAGQGPSHPGLLRKALRLEPGIHWVRPDMAPGEGESAEYLFRIRYRQPLQRGRLYLLAEGNYIVFEQLQRGITSGQFAAWYTPDGDLAGSAVIAG